jgi:non-ribosomal peptide synthase protein (TIGR01720 family)
VIYTSGSTGTPKGVEITHRNVMRLFRATDENFHFGPGDVWALFHSYAFDFSVWEIFGALLYGGRLVVVPYLTSRSPELFDELLRRERVTVLNQTPSAFRSLVSLSSAAPPEDLRWVIFGGEALDFTLVESWLRSEGTRPRLVNMYGITETTVHVTHRLLGPGDGSAVSGSRIGAAISDLSIWLLDQDGSLAPIAVPGEIHVGGAGLARGYCGRPQTTAEKFVPHPAPPAPGDRLYRAGDWARYWPDRDLEYLGRKDHQVKIRGFRIELGEIEKALAQHPAVSQCAVLVRDDALRERRIVGYVVTDGSAVTEGELRAHLQRKLPGHMVPAVFAFVDRLPLTPSGKLDPRALPPPEGARRPVEDDYVAPRNETEAALSLIWQEVLGLDRVGVHDNFFALGGDSILSIQVVARSGARGLKLTPRQIFQFPTVSALAEVVGQAPRVSAEQHPVAGPVELTPIQRWYLEIDPEPRHFNQAFLLDLTHRLDPSLLRETLAELIGHHDALRLRLQRQTSSFTLENLTPEEARVRGIFVQVDLLALPAVHQGSAVEEVTTRLQESLLPSEAPLIRAACFELTASSQRLFLAAHHLAVDGLSWRILLEDMFSAYEQRWRGRPIVLPPKTTSFQAWSKRIHQHATSESLAAEASYWREILASPSGRLPLDRSDGENLSGSAETVAVSLSREETDALLHSVSSAYRTQINDLLLCALGQELTAWCQSDAVLVDLESHGREDLFEDVDVSRTVGWFTSIFPFRLAPGGGGPPGAALKRVKEDLRRVPRGGIGFGLLRYLRGGAEGAALATARPEVSFNYLGQLDAFLAGQVPVRFAPESIGPPRNPESLRSHLLEINGAVRDGELQFAWTYSRNRHAPATIEKRASSFLAFLRALIEHCLQPDSGGATPSDFPLARLDSAELDEIVGTAREVEDLYGLAPLQQGILVHSIGTPGSGPYFQQFCWGIEGNVESELMRRAWERLVQRHAILRTAFVWEGLGRPVQIVYRTARLPWQYQDWRGDSAREQSDRLRQFLDTDRGRGFDLTRPPLLRVALLRLAENRWYLAWSHHHLILDAWSVDILWKELIHSYEALRRNQDIRLERARPYGDFIGWLERRDLAVAEVFWRRTLTGLKRPTRLPLERPGNVGGVEADGYRRESATLPQPDAAALQQLARRESVEIDTLAPAAFAVLLNRYTNEIDVVFGAAVDGRSNPVPGIQSMLGVLMNTLCLRLQPRPERRTVGWLRESQQHFDAALAHEHTSLSLQERWSEVPAVSGGRPLFESVVVVENRPIDPSRHSIAGRFSLSQVFRRRQTSFPLTLYVAPAQGFTLEIVYDVRRYEAAAMTRMLGHLSCLLASIAAAGAAAGESSLSELSMLTPVERKQVLAEIGAGKERSVEGRDLDVQLLDGLLDPVSIGVPGEIPGGAEAGSFQYAAPRSETEQELSRIWALALGVDRVGIFDDFFALGGDSVAAIRAASLARHAGFLLTPVQLFENPTIAGLSAAGTTVLETPSAERAVEAPGSLPILPDPPDVPSPIANVDGEMLRPLSKDGEIEDLYRLSPMQAGILFHSLYAPHSSAYFDQHSCTLEGPFDARAFRDAWMRSVERHPILRTCFTWEGLAEPMQIVRPKVELPWVEHDWRNLPSDLRSERLSSLLRADRMHGFDLTRAPLMRLTLIRLSETSFYLLWSHHHLLLDGWSVPLLLTEVMLTYESLLRGQPIALGPAAPFRSYIDWLRVQDLSEAEAFWRRSLSGFIETTPLKIGEVSQGALGDGEAHGEAEILLSPESTAALEAFSRRERMTANTVIQGAWGLLLSRYSGREDVLFGATVSGRSAPIPGVETAVGLFINAVPIRLRVRPTSRLSAWLKEIQERQSEAREYEHAPLAEVQSWSDLPQGAPLFESLLAFENFPLDRTLSERGGSLRIRDVQVYDRTNYPLTLIIIPGPQLLLRANYDRQRFADSSMRRLVGRLSRLIENMVGRREALLEELQIDTEAEIGSAPPILSGRAGGSELSGSSSAG